MDLRQPVSAQVSLRKPVLASSTQPALFAGAIPQKCWLALENKKMTTTQPLIFDDPSGKQGICQDIDFFCKSTLATYPKADKVRNVNLGLDAVADLIQKVSDTWHWEDTNQTDLPIATTNLVANQRDYSINTAFLTILGVYIKKSSTATAYTEITLGTKTNVFQADTAITGVPSTFFPYGNSLFLDPMPNASITTGLKIAFERNIIYFATDATTATVPYNPQFTRLATMYACRDYSMANGKVNLEVVLNEIAKLEGRITSAYARRNKVQQRGLRPNVENNH